MKLKNRYRVRLTTDIIFNWQANPKPTAQGVIYMNHGPSSIVIWRTPVHEISSHDAELESEVAYNEITQKLGQTLQDLFNP